MSKDDLVYLGHILDIARKTTAKTRDITRAEFDKDENLRLALTHLLQNIGEAASNVSREFRIEHPDIPWKAIVGMRHKVVHDYMNVDDNVVWETATTELPPLVAALEKIVPPEPPTSAP